MARELRARAAALANAARTTVDSYSHGILADFNKSKSHIVINNNDYLLLVALSLVILVMAVFVPVPIIVLGVYGAVVILTAVSLICAAVRWCIKRSKSHTGGPNPL